MSRKWIDGASMLTKLRDGGEMGSRIVVRCLRYCRYCMTGLSSSLSRVSSSGGQRLRRETRWIGRLLMTTCGMLMASLMTANF